MDHLHKFQMPHVHASISNILHIVIINNVNSNAVIPNLNILMSTYYKQLNDQQKLCSFIDEE